MPYAGSDSDDLVHRFPGFAGVRDGLPLPPGDVPVPERVAEVLGRAADHLGVSPMDPRARRQLREWYEQVSPRYVISRKFLRPDALSASDARHHPRRLRYRVDARTRITAHLLEHPGWIADSWSAAALLGIGDFSDGADTCVTHSGNRRLSTDPLRPTQHRKPASLPVWTVYLNDAPMKVTPPTVTLIRCLRSVLIEEHAWQVPKIARLSEPLIRAVQVTDRFRRGLGIDERHIAEVGRGLIDARKLARIISLSGPGTDSPQETLLRLIAGQAAARFGAEFLPQVPVYCDGRIGESCSKETGVPLLTVLDLAEVTWKIALMFDGAHHWTKKQRERDARINFELAHSGWLVLRVSYGMFNDASGLAAKIEEAIRERISEAAA